LSVFFNWRYIHIEYIDLAYLIFLCYNSLDTNFLNLWDLIENSALTLLNIFKDSEGILREVVRFLRFFRWFYQITINILHCLLKTKILFNMVLRGNIFQFVYNSWVFLKFLRKFCHYFLCFFFQSRDLILIPLQLQFRLDT